MRINVSSIDENWRANHFVTDNDSELNQIVNLNDFRSI